jgi:Uncharacterised nucleotidyltransferase
MHGTGSRLEPEWTILRTACFAGNRQAKLSTMHALLGRPIRWRLLFELADRHGVLPLLANTLLSLQEAIPPERFSFLQKADQANVLKTLLLSRELIRILDHLTRQDIEVIPYKGLALAEIIYGDIALRQAGDIDLLIRAVDLRRAHVALGELGYTPHLQLSEAEQQAYLKSGYEYAFDGASGPHLLEVQWAVQPRFYTVDLAVDGLFERAFRATVAGYPIKALSLEDLFVVLALHAAKHVWTRLIWLSDLARIIRCPLDWSQIAFRARQLGIVRILRVTLTLAIALDTPIPEMADETLPEDPAAPLLAHEIQGFMGSETAMDVDSLAYFRLMLRLRERRRDRFRFLTRLVFTPGPGEWAVARLPKPLFPLYRLVRLSRLARKLAGA